MTNNSDEIDLIQLLKKVYKGKKIIFIVTFVFTLTGIFYTLSQPNQFTSSTIFIPQLSSGAKSGASSLSGLASLAGVNLGGIGESSSEFPANLYPNIVNSVPFKLDLLFSKIEVNSNAISIREYYSNPENFSENLKRIDFDKNNIYSISENDELLFNKISSKLTLELNQKEGFITISVTDKNNRVAAQIAKIAKDLLQDKIIKFKNQSSKAILDFSIKQYNESKLSFEALQDETAIFVDKNQNISSSLYQNKLNRLESDLEVSRSVLIQLASQVEQSKLYLNKNTPVFITIQPVTIPFLKSGPFRSREVIFYILIGFVLSLGYILSKDLIILIFNSVKS